MLGISDTEIKSRFKLDNPWWESAKIQERFAKLPRRQYFPSFLELVQKRDPIRAAVLMGPRRVGKTVMIYQAIQALLDKKVSPKTIFYISLETPIYTGLGLEQLLNRFLELQSFPTDQELYVFFDEIQYLPDWEVHLKSLVDTFPSMKFIASGSAAAALRLKSNESGAGRFTDFILPPLSFYEFLSFTGFSFEEIDFRKVLSFFNNKPKLIAQLNQRFIDYINFGGYPEAIFSEEVKQGSAQFIKSDILDKVLLRDLPSLYGIDNTQELNRFFTVIAYNTGNEVSYDKLSQNSGVAKNTVKKYLEYLEAAFLIKIVHRVDQNAKRFQRVTHFKVYLTNPSMRSALFGFVQDGDEALERLVETAIISQFFHSPISRDLYYARWQSKSRGSEVDLVILNPSNQEIVYALEVKWSDNVVKSKLEGLLDLQKSNKVRRFKGFTTKSKFIIIDDDGEEILGYPSTIQALSDSMTLIKEGLDWNSLKKHP